MKTKKLLLPIIILIIAVILSASYSVFSGIEKHPTLKEAEFPFSITYKHNEETVTINEKYVCEFIGADSGEFDQIRYWNGYIEGCEDANYYLVSETEAGKLYVCPSLYAGYLMGDPLANDYYTDDSPYEPYAMFYSADGIEYTDAETIAAQNFEIIDWDYPQPITNKFVVSAISPLSGDSVTPLLVIAVAAFALCLVCVKKENDLERGIAHKISVVLNFLIGLVVIPFITILSIFSDINGCGTEFIYQVIYCVPAVSVLCLALSLSLRRKGFSKSSLVVQAIIPIVFVVVMGIAEFAIG